MELQIRRDAGRSIMERVILWILAVGAVLGGLDLLIGNRFGLGERFEE